MVSIDRRHRLLTLLLVGLLAVIPLTAAAEGPVVGSGSRSTITTQEEERGPVFGSGNSSAITTEDEERGPVVGSGS